LYITAYTTNQLFVNIMWRRQRQYIRNLKYDICGTVKFIISYYIITLTASKGTNINKAHTNSQ